MTKRKQGQHIPVSMRALVQRINRRLKADDEVLKSPRGRNARQQLGEYFVLELTCNAVYDTHIDPEAFGRKLGVLTDFEYVDDEEGK